MKKIIGLSGNITRPSRTRMLVETVLTQIGRHAFTSTENFDLIDAGPELGRTVSRKDADGLVERIWLALETADALVLGSPVFKASYSGLFKHLFDLMDKDSLAGKPIILIANARLPDYAATADIQLRSLFGFFRARPVDQRLLASEADFLESGGLSASFSEKVDLAIDQLFQMNITDI
jgi:FMN reductase